MEQYENNLDMAILEELSLEDARGYLIWKFWHDFAERTIEAMQENLQNNFSHYEN